MNGNVLPLVDFLQNILKAGASASYFSKLTIPEQYATFKLFPNVQEHEQFFRLTKSWCADTSDTASISSKIVTQSTLEHRDLVTLAEFNSVKCVAEVYQNEIQILLDYIESTSSEASYEVYKLLRTGRI